MGEAIRAWKDYRAVADEFQELDGERVVVCNHATGRGRTSGLEVGQVRAKTANLFHVRDGRVTRLVIYWDRDRAFDDLGLPPEDTPVESD